jgi:hypothetical protein
MPNPSMRLFQKQLINHIKSTPRIWRILLTKDIYFQQFAFHCDINN